MASDDAMIIGVLVLAAGRSTRFGSDKRIAHLPDGERVLFTQLHQIALSGLSVHVCLHPDDRALACQLQEREVDYSFYDRAPEGMGGTLAQAMTRPGTWDGTLVALADMPWIQSDTYLAVAGALTTRNICVPIHRGRRGHPVGFGSRHYPALAKLQGPAGARGLLGECANDVIEVSVDDPGIHWDIDVPEDIDRGSL